MSESPQFDPLVQELSGATSIEASAGTGKTYSITLLWVRLLVEEGLRVERCWHRGYRVDPLGRRNHGQYGAHRK